MDDMLARLEYLNEVGSALSREKDIDRLLESILVAAKHIARADGGTLYRVGDDHQSLRFEIIRTDSLGIAMGGSTGRTVPFAPSSFSHFERINLRLRLTVRTVTPSLSALS